MEPGRLVEKEQHRDLEWHQEYCERGTFPFLSSEVERE